MKKKSGKWSIHTRICIDCGKVCENVGPRLVRCPECKKKKARADKKIWGKTRPSRPSRLRPSRMKKTTKKRTKAQIADQEKFRAWLKKKKQEEIVAINGTSIHASTLVTREGRILSSLDPTKFDNMFYPTREVAGVVE